MIQKTGLSEAEEKILATTKAFEKLPKRDKSEAMVRSLWTSLVFVDWFSLC